MDDIKRYPRLGPTHGPEDQHGPFAASELRQHFHRPDCKWASYIKNRLEYRSHAEAVEAGKKPCKPCRA